MFPATPTPLARRWLIAAALLTGFPARPATAADPVVPPAPAARLVLDGLDAAGRLHLSANRSVVLTTVSPYSKLNLANPAFAEVNAIAPTQLLVTAKSAGLTQLIVWDDRDRAQVIDLLISPDLAILQDQLARQFPSTPIDVSGAADGLVLRGRVPDLHAARQVTQLAAPFGKVVNLLEVGGGQQVMLQVRFMEVSRSALNALGVDISTSVSNGDFNLGLSGRNALGAADRSLGIGAGGTFGDFTFEVLIDALKRNNLARVLAEPNVTVLSGEQGDFLAGGEVPIPVPQSAGAGTGGSTITIEYKEFGVRLRCTPVVLGDGRVRMKVSPEVSELDYANGTSIGGQVVPGLKTRKVNTTVEMADGQTFMIAGLLNRKVEARNQSAPFLGDVPVLGALFRSVRYERSETELVILVTPRLVEPMNPDEVPPLPGAAWRYPNEAELFVNGDLGGPVKDGLPEGSTTDRTPPRFLGRHGFVEETPATPETSATR